MKYPLIIILLLYGASGYAQHVVINEVMYAPIKPEPEWIELFNPSGATVSINGWTISNHLHTYILLTDTIAPQGYIVLTKDSANYLKGKYDIPDAHILQTTLPSLVNTGDDIVFRDSTGTIIDSLYYKPTFGGDNGRSLERIDYAAPTDSADFSTSTDSLGATPGKANSTRRRDYDLALESLSSMPLNQNDLNIIATIRNKGRNSISDGTISLFSRSGLPVSQTQITATLAPLQKQDFQITWQNADFGKSSLTAVINQAQDEMHINDTLRHSVYLPIPRNAIVINEIMPTPLSSSSEWIELYNNSLSTASLDSTMLWIGNTDTIYKYKIDSLIIEPKHYAIIDASSKFFSQFPTLKGADGVVVLGKSTFNLADSGSEVMILNTDGSVIDSLHYYSNWYSSNVANHSNISLERKQSGGSSTDPSNWSSSLDPRGSTPLEKNSYSDDSLPAPSAYDVQISPNPFSPDGDGYNDATNITISIPGDKEEVISVKLYDLRGRLRSTLALAQRVFRTESIRFEGKDDNGMILPIGLYTLVVESANGTFAPQRKGLVIIKKPR